MRFQNSKQIFTTMQLRKIKGFKVYYLSDDGDVYRLMATYKRNSNVKAPDSVTLSEDGKKSVVYLGDLMKSTYPELFNIDLTDFFTPIEYDMWQKKINSLKKDQWAKFNDKLVMEIRRRRLYQRGTSKRLEVLERLLKV